MLFKAAIWKPKTIKWLPEREKDEHLDMNNKQ